MTTLFLYYSYTGNGDLVAEAFRERGADVHKVVPKKSLPKSFFGAMMTGGFLAAVGHKAPLIGFDPNFERYDRVIIGSPIWNGRLSCPINTVLAESDFTGKELAFVLYAGGGEAPKAVKKLQTAYPNVNIVVLKEPKKYLEELEKLSVIE